MAESLLIVDVNNYLFRAYHAIGTMRTRDGTATNAVYGLANALVLLRDTYPEAAVACVMDAPGPTFRHEMYPKYKANRPELDEDLRVQIAPSKELAQGLGMALYCVPAVEADDVIASLAVAAVAAGTPAVVASSDKDLMYLAGRGVKIHDPKRGEQFDADGVAARYKVRPEQMVDYLALVGDSSDNVPGVPGIGRKRASDLLATYGSIDSIIEHQDELKGAMGEKFRAAIPDLPLIRKLVTVLEDVKLDPALGELDVPQPQVDELEDLCDRLRFNPALRERLLKRPVARAPKRKLKMAAVVSDDQAEEMAAAIAQSKQFGAHIETDGSDGPAQRIVGIAIAAGGNAWYLPLEHAGALELAAVGERAAGAVKDAVVAADRDGRRTLFGGKPAVHAFRNRSQDLGGFQDAHLLAYSVDSSAAGSLPSLLRRFGLQSAPERRELIGARLGAPTFADLDGDKAAAAACAWAAGAEELRRSLMLNTNAAQLKIYDRLERPLVDVLVRMETAGILIDEAQLGAISRELEKRMAGMEQKVAEAAGEQVNLNSPAKLAELLYDKLKLAAGRKTRSGTLSTNEAELERLARIGESPVPGWLLEYRQAAKLHGTYTSALPKRINPATGRVHTSFIQTGAVTGRLASVDPNLQNIPVRTADGRRIRQCFIAAPGAVLLSADYSQIELRILAHFSGDETLRKAFAAGEDVHGRTAAELFEIAPDAVDADQRRFAKTINFGLIYGMGAHGLAQRMDIPNKRAAELISRYFERMPGVKDYLDKLKEQAVADRAVTTVCGRRIAVAPGGPGAAHGNALRAAVNAPMQGSAADIMKLAMIEVDRRLIADGFKARMLLQVHDELVFEAPQDEAERLGSMLAEAMSGVIKLDVPLTVDVGTGSNWDEAH